MLQDFQKAALLELAKNGGFQFTQEWFPYPSGQIGPYDIQSMDILKTNIGFSIAIDSLLTIVEQIIIDSDQGVDIISGGESRDWPFSLPLAEKLSVAPLMLYKDGKIIGADPKFKRVLHVADLNNEGSSPRDLWIPAIRKAGGNITDIVFLVDRLEDGVQEMEKLGCVSHAVIPLNEEAWNVLKEEGFITEKFLNSLLDYWKDRKAWGIKKLIEYPELLTELIRKDDAKALKVFEMFYPLMGKDLLVTQGVNSVEEFMKNYY